MNIIKRKDTKGRRRLRDISCRRYLFLNMQMLLRTPLNTRRTPLQSIAPRIPYLHRVYLNACAMLELVSRYRGIYRAIKYCNTVSKMHEHLEIKTSEEPLFTVFFFLKNPFFKFYYFFILLYFILSDRRNLWWFH